MIVLAVLVVFVVGGAVVGGAIGRALAVAYTLRVQRKVAAAERGQK